MSQTSKERLAIANSAQPKLGPHRVRPAHLLSSSLQGLLLAEKWDWRITPGGTAFLWHLKAFAHEGQKHSWCGRVSALQIASHLQTRSVCCGSITPKHPHPHPACSHCLCDNSSERKDVLSLCHRPEKRVTKSLWQHPLDTVTFTELKGLMWTRNILCSRVKDRLTFEQDGWPKV